MTAEWYGRAEGEGPAPRRGPVGQVAVLSDVHANVVALESVLADPAVRDADLIVFCGDLTWGPEPRHTLDIVADLGERALFVRGNADRAVVELAAGRRKPTGVREAWVCGQHSAADVRLLARFPFSVIVEIDGLGPVRFCHGSPRSDTELVTPATPASRLAELAALIREPILVTGHTHLQFDRPAGLLRNLNPGSVGLPFHDGVPGTAYWAVLGPKITLRCSRFDVGDAVARLHRSGYPGAEVIAGLLLAPPSVAEVTSHAEGLVFSD